jgi:ParB-like chromosome segregation protein Spo0J
MKLAIKYQPISDLIPYARNARKHPERQIMQLAGSIREFGFVNPVIVDADGSIVAGHGRVLAAQRLGLNEVPTLSVEHLTPQQVKAFRLADNRLAEVSEWDFELLALEIEDIGADVDWLEFKMPPEDTIVDTISNVKGHDFEEKLENHLASGFRTMQMAFRVEDFDRVMTALSTASKKLEVDTNTDCVIKLLEIFLEEPVV